MEQKLYTSSAEGLPKIVKSAIEFKGDEGNPLLAPRGVWLLQNTLIVSDTGQNRIFIWNNLPSDAFERPDVVLGQTDSYQTGRNGGVNVSASTLQYPSGLWSDSQRLIVADAWNHRVLIWHQFPTQNGQPADVVLGQPDFNQNLPNFKGIGASPSAQSLNWPYGVFSDGRQLWIADTGNRRILYYKNVPTVNFHPADEVIGKPSFEERDYENHEPIWPYSVRISPTGQMAVADTQYYRTLIWHNWKTAFTQPADVIVGQPDFISNGMNQFNLTPQQNSLNWTYDTFFYKEGLLVADTGNSRILWFDTIPTQNAAFATNLIGQSAFTIGSENANTRYGTEKQLYWPFSICMEGSILAVADTGNHRILLFEIAL
jgi:hypothetical protein